MKEANAGGLLKQTWPFISFYLKTSANEMNSYLFSV